MNREVELKKLGAGTYFGEVSLLSGKEATATVEVLQAPVKAVAVDREAVMELVKQDERVRKMLEGVTLARAKDTISKVLK
jgi:CRP-like cAMP-binding protein